MRHSLLSRIGTSIAVALTAAGCGSGSLNPPGLPMTPRLPPVTSTPTGWGDGPNRKVDLLFMVDNSPDMDSGQSALAAAIPAFMNTLAALPGGLPDLHIAVVSSDMGGGDGSIVGCAGNGDSGVFHYAPTGSCTATLDPNATFLSAPIGGTPNFAGDIRDALGCIIRLGSNGCGFEHQLASVARALGADGAPPPYENQGFLRPEALLAIVLVTNEDDCSAPASSVLYDTSANENLSSQVGPPANFRCNEFGHLCSLNGGPLAPTQRLAPPGTINYGDGGVGAGGAGGSMFGGGGGPGNPLATLTYSTADGPDTCISAETSGLLVPVRDYADHIKALKSDPQSQILITAIAGPTTPYVVDWRSPPIADTGPWPFLAHSCKNDVNLTVADPAVRIQQFVREFDAAGSLDSYCAGDYAPPLNRVAAWIAATTGLTAGSP